MGWAEQLRASNEALVKKVTRFKRKVAVDALSSIVNLTRVDTGRARGNWQLTIGKPATSESDIEDKSGALTVQAGSLVAQQAELRDDIWISNNVPYIVVLEYGGENRQPHPMVRPTVARFEEFLRRNRDALE